MTLHRLVMKADQALHAGAGKGSGFSRTTFSYVPAATLRGALGAVWWRDHHGAAQDDFDSRIASLTFTDAVPTADPGTFTPLAAALDRRVCRAAHRRDHLEAPPQGYPMSETRCPICGRELEMSKGKRQLPQGASVTVSTRVTLDGREQALDEHLYEREGLDARAVWLVALVAGNPRWLVKEGAVIRVGAASTVAGRMTVTSVDTVSPVDVTVPQGTSRLRVEMLTPGVFVDDYGRATSEPSSHDLRLAMGLDTNVAVAVEQSFVRWMAASGWHTKAGRPKPEDPAVIAHSCYYISVTVPRDLTVPSVVSQLGLRTTEGCGWARISTLEEVA